ncbi:MAG: signal peptidase II [Eubacteriales bacterium]|nr:signal peptidase II [Eubacteriales bacterium]
MALALYILLILAADLGSKYLVRSFLAGGPSVSLIGDFFTLTYVENRGAAFGILSNKSYGPFFLLAFSLVLTLALLYLLTKLRSAGLRLGLVLVIAGSLGNTIDRLLRGFVTDFLTFKFGSWYFPSFNLADTSIVLGSLLMAALLLWHGEAQADLDRVLTGPAKGERGQS